LTGERAAELVGGVGGKAALASSAFALGGKGGIQPAQQPVDGVGQVLELVVGPGGGQPLVQGVRGELPGGGVIVRNGRSTRPATSQPATTETASTTASAIPDRTSPCHSRSPPPPGPGLGLLL
jgi:hypothetical protein